ncbi:MAG TPA: hypothetical protein V6C97_06290 [Oculatellaceae cyanobacterium]
MYVRTYGCTYQIVAEHTCTALLCIEVANKKYNVSEQRARRLDVRVEADRQPLVPRRFRERERETLFMAKWDNWLRMALPRSFLSDGGDSCAYRQRQCSHRHRHQEHHRMITTSEQRHQQRQQSALALLC